MRASIWLLAIKKVPDPSFKIILGGTGLQQSQDEQAKC